MGSWRVNKMTGAKGVLQSAHTWVSPGLRDQRSLYLTQEDGSVAVAKGMTFPDLWYTLEVLKVR
jgi:hypothetical protein